MKFFRLNSEKTIGTDSSCCFEKCKICLTTMHSNSKKNDITEPKAATLITKQLLTERQLQAFRDH